MCHTSPPLLATRTTPYNTRRSSTMRAWSLPVPKGLSRVRPNTRKFTSAGSLRPIAVHNPAPGAYNYTPSLSTSSTPPPSLQQSSRSVINMARSTRNRTYSSSVVAVDGMPSFAFAFECVSVRRSSIWHKLTLRSASTVFFCDRLPLSQVPPTLWLISTTTRSLSYC